MSVFPTLTKVPSYPLDPDGDQEDAVLRSPMEAGYEQTRPLFTRARRSWGVNYRALGESDVAALRGFERTTLRNGADAFTWTHPIEGAAYTVRLAGPMRFKRTVAGLVTDVSFTLREV